MREEEEEEKEEEREEEQPSHEIGGESWTGASTMYCTGGGRCKMVFSSGPVTSSAIIVVINTACTLLHYFKSVYYHVEQPVAIS